MHLSRRTIGSVLIILAALAARTVYSLCVNFNEGNTLYLQDYTQIYLIGLKFFTTGIWPYWGPDITYTDSQIPGALQGLLVGLPFFVLKLPEAPFLLLNLLSASALVFFAWYITQRIPGLPAWFVYAWLLTAPWTMNYSTTVINPSYLLLPAIFFFISIIELLPIYGKKILPPGWAWFLAGLTTGWILQLHMSWVLLPFFILTAITFLVLSKDTQRILKGFSFLALGLLAGLATLFPTLIRFGLMTGDTTNTMAFNPDNLTSADVITRFISFSTFDARQFIAGGWQGVKDLLADSPLGAPFIIFVYVAGLLQTIYYLTFFFRKTAHPEFLKVKLLTAGTMLLVYLSYLFAAREVASYTFYLVLPLSFWFSFYCLEKLLEKPAWRNIAIIFILSGLVYHFTLARTYYETNSLNTRRAKICKALQDGDSRIFAHRRIPYWERTEQERYWLRCPQGEADQLDLCFYQDFDNFPPEIRPEALNRHFFVSPPFSCQVDSLHPFSIALTLRPEEIGTKRTLSIKLYRRYTEVNECLLVSSVSLHGKPVFWVGDRLCGNPAHPGSWKDTSVTHTLPDRLDPAARIGIYVWLPPSNHMKEIQVDNMKIELK